MKKSAAAPKKTKASPAAPATAQAKRGTQASGTTAKAAAAKKQPQVAARQTTPAPKAVPSQQARKARKSNTATARSATRPAPVAASAEPAGAPQGFEKQISARSAIILDAKTGGELFTKYPDNPRQPASTIKIVTAMIAIKSLKDNDVVEVSNHAASMPSSKVFLETSKRYQADDLINAVLLSSANDASVALAEKVAGSEESFANLMTISARMWGARNTVCRTASGLTALGQQSTSRDLANIFRYAMQHEEFARRMREKSVTTSYGKVLRNHNKALWKVDGALAGKTGYTVAARQTYVGQFSRNGQTIVVALMGSETMWADLGKLVEYGFKKQRDEQLARLGSSAVGGVPQSN
ncbi:serine hydrolase [Desulfobulbus sp.]|uniref:D-alanyl-D-alanine carboxypeptidase family protein n=1 Tax=Desulfobulbus sp. TaxID=895 RepID=UPI00286F8222|nr:serine hydrolase [Desulfobulbus sp.]